MYTIRWRRGILQNTHTGHHECVSEGTHFVIRCVHCAVDFDAKSRVASSSPVGCRSARKNLRRATMCVCTPISVSGSAQSEVTKYNKFDSLWTRCTAVVTASRVHDRATVGKTHVIFRICAINIRLIVVTCILSHRPVEPGRLRQRLADGETDVTGRHRGVSAVTAGTTSECAEENTSKRNHNLQDVCSPRYWCSKQLQQPRVFVRALLPTASIAVRHLVSESIPARRRVVFCGRQVRVSMAGLQLMQSGVVRAVT
jgi:hypothetical protein